LALWNGTSINSNETAMVINQQAKNKAIAMVTKNNGLFNALTGNNDPEVLFKRAEKMVRVSGKQIEVTLRGKNASPAYLTDGAAELANWDWASQYDSAIFGGAVFDIAHMVFGLPIPSSEMDRFRGKELKTLDYMDELLGYCIDGYENLIGNDLHGTSAPARNKVGGWQYAVDDANVYGTINRSDSGNVDFRGVVDAALGQITLPKIQLAKNKVKKNRGRLAVGVAEDTIFTAIQQIANSYTVAIQAGNTAEVGSDNVILSKVEWILDHRCSAGTIGMFTPETWIYWMNKKQPFTKAGVWYNGNIKAGYSLNTEMWVQDICLEPAKNYKATGVTP
jgi:hypothetical protein